MTMLDIRIPSILKIGAGALNAAPEVLRELGCRRPLLVTDPFLFQQESFGRLLSLLREAEFSATVFSQTVPDPTSTVVQAGIEQFRAGAFDSLVAIGGGSPMDTAKAIGVLAANGGAIRDYKVPNAIPKPVPPVVAIPTTAGTGSEVSRFTVVTDAETQEKMLIMGAAIMPSAALVDYELTLEMPFRLTADTGTDALTHSIEAYVSRRANPFSDAFALTAMRTIWKHLPHACFEPDNRKAREAMMLAATQAGLAFSNSSVALVHGMSRPLGAIFHIAHGLSNAMLLPAVTEFSVSSAPARYAACARAMEIADAADSNEQAGDKLVAELYRRNRELQVPSPRRYGIPREAYLEAIPLMVAQALASGSPANNPRVPEAGQIAQLYRDAWD